ncbi:alkylhydroperoxidase domain protein [Ewingella sp. S1.OA.A_B6]
MTANTQATDLLDQLAAIEANSELAQARTTRDAATRYTQGSYDIIFNANDNVDFTLTERLLLAENVARWHGDNVLASHYAERLSSVNGDGNSDRLQTAFDHAERLSFKPASATAAHLQTLQLAGWTFDAIVTLSQLIAFVSYQTRVLRSYRLVGRQPVENASDKPAGAAFWRTEGKTHSGRSAPKAFTQEELGWEPWIAAKKLAQFDTEQQAILARFGHTDSDYFRLLGRNLPVLEQRTLTDKGIFYTSSGLPRKERELAATVASKINGCIYCASVHARKAAQLSKQPDEVQKLIDTPPGGILSQGQSPRWQAEIDFAAALSATPPTASDTHIVRLREQGLSTLEIVDLAQSAAFFAWANRLMLTLGEPFND